ncbi:alpha/beta hydrolase [Dinghuibacter silviterrae]|uniref:Acetyl esterase/lipase n=1 Tax=Dinghuibacter silviterrae TaxID=1539049 RepID=A0A4R8DTU6_9BACT|nr:alpha/beta hydrolase [Dinghuibacter silviterrae]TDX01336.1 acetyl esterase/lipase [Dinghuibacter silviterrae]
MIRLVLLSLLTLTALLTVCKAPTYHLWLLAIGVTEFPWIPVGCIVLLLLAGYWLPARRWTGTWVGLVGLSLSLSPIIRAYTAAATLQYTLGQDEARERLPFRWTRMFRGSAAVPFTTVTYKDSLTMDVYPDDLPNGDIVHLTPRPCILVIHGGSWSGGSSRQLPELNWVLARQGYVVASMNYRLAPRFKNPAPIRDVASALAFLRAHAARWHIDTTRFVLLGRSAGAQIALMAAYTLPTGKDTRGRTAPGSGIRGVIDFYGPTDMVWGYSAPASRLVMDSRKVMEDYLGGSYQKVPEHYVASSPLEAVDPHAPPTLLIHGRNDVVVAYEHSVRLDAKLTALGVPHYFLSLPWATHAFDYTLNGPSGQLSTYAVEVFLDKVTH